MYLYPLFFNIFCISLISFIDTSSFLDKLIHFLKSLYSSFILTATLFVSCTNRITIYVSNIFLLCSGINKNKKETEIKTIRFPLNLIDRIEDAIKIPSLLICSVKRVFSLYSFIITSYSLFHMTIIFLISVNF